METIFCPYILETPLRLRPDRRRIGTFSVGRGHLRSVRRLLVTAQIMCSDFQFFESTRKLQACNYTFIALTMLNSFEPTIWAIFRGIIAVYTCIGLVVSSVYSALSEAQLRGTLTVTETMYVGGAPFRLLDGMSGLYVASLLTVRLL